MNNMIKERDLGTREIIVEAKKEKVIGSEGQ